MPVPIIPTPNARVEIPDAYSPTRVVRRSTSRRKEQSDARRQRGDTPDREAGADLPVAVGSGSRGGGTQSQRDGHDERDDRTSRLHAFDSATCGVDRSR